jgi:ATP-binding cassette, subfamily C, bacterial CydCD
MSATSRPGGRRLLAPDARGRRRVLLAAGLGVTGQLAAIGLLATGAWLLLSAALRPPILLLSVAVGAVQLFALARGAARYGERLASHDLGLGLQARLRTWLYRRLERLLPAGLPGGDRGDLLTRLISDTEEAQDLVVRAVVPVAATALAWLAAALAATVLLPPAGGMLLATGLLGASGVAVAALLGGRRAAALPAARGAVGAWVLQALTSAEELVALGAEEWAATELAARERALGAGTRAVAVATGLARAAAALAGGAGLAGVAWTGCSALRARQIGPIELGVLAFLALGVAALLQGLPDALSRLPVSRSSLRRLADLDRLPDPVTGPAGNRTEHLPGLVTAAARARPEHPPGPAPPPGPADGHGPGRPAAATIALRGAAVAYPSHSVSAPLPVLSDVDLELAPGRPVALAGPSGSGKTALVLALLRFIDLAAGEMTVNGTDARAVPPDQLRALLAWSPEQPALFPASLRANLRLGARHATDAQIAGLLADLGLGPWLDHLDGGLDTVLAPWGHPVSGGELQRVSLARAMLADRPVLLLDEPTSHLDAATADAVLATVLGRTSHQSVLWVTHRPAELAAFPDVVSVRPSPSRLPSTHR